MKPWVSVADSVGAGGEIDKAIVEKFRQVEIEIPQFREHEVRILGEAAA